MTILLRVNKLEAFYGQIRALHGLDFQLEEGGVTTLLGANGAGKTTTLRALCGMVRGTGDVTFAGDETRPNLTVVQVGVGGKIDLYASTRADVIFDVAGWMS